MAANNFAACLAVTLKWEGGYSDDPRDKGGPTKFGVTIATLSHELGRKATRTDVMNMTVAQAAEIYRKKFWNLIDGDTLPAGVDMLLFDIAVNAGPGRALQWDVGIGNYPAVQQINMLDRRRRSFWRALKTFITFGGGWMRRENGVLAVALKMAAS